MGLTERQNEDWWMLRSVVNLWQPVTNNYRWTQQRNKTHNDRTETWRIRWPIYKDCYKPRRHDNCKLTAPPTVKCCKSWTTWEVLEAKLKHLKTKKAGGHDKISNKIIPCLLPPLTSIFLFLGSILVFRGHYPMVWSHGLDGIDDC